MPGASRDEPDFVGKHFAQFIPLDAQGGSREGIGERWVRTLTSALRRYDELTLIRRDQCTIRSNGGNLTQVASRAIWRVILVFSLQTKPRSGDYCPQRRVLNNLT